MCDAAGNPSRDCTRADGKCESAHYHAAILRPPSPSYMTETAAVLAPAWTRGGADCGPASRQRRKDRQGSRTVIRLLVK